MEPLIYGPHTFLFFFIFEGGHLPFFLRRRFRRSLLRLCLIFLASFIFSFCSNLSCNLDSRGRLSTDLASPELSKGRSRLPVTLLSSSAEAETNTFLLSQMPMRLKSLALSTDPHCKEQTLCPSLGNGLAEAEAAARDGERNAKMVAEPATGAEEENGGEKGSWRRHEIGRAHV